MKKVLFCVALALAPSPASADPIVIGPGDVPTASAHAGSGNSINTQLVNPATLGPGTYTATLFDYRFLDAEGLTVIGSITPLVMTVVKPDFSDVRPVAIGDGVTFTGTTPFVSAAFGGSDTFTLATATTVYAGFYWQSPDFTGNLDFRDPIPYVHPGSGTNVVGYFNGAAAPVIGTPITAPSRGLDDNLFAFSIQIEPAPAPVVPEPSTLLLALAGGVGLLGWCWLRLSAKLRVRGTNHNRPC
jgi:hypothetical protein